MWRKAGEDGGDEGAGALEIEFEDGDESSGAGGGYSTAGGRLRDLRPAALIALGVAVLGAALAATHSTGSSDAGITDRNSTTIAAVAPDYAAFVVTVDYRSSRLVSLAQRRIEVDLRITPVPGAQVEILNYYISENGITSEPAPSATPVPASGVDVKMELDVTDCAVVPIGESMGFVDVVADGPAGTTDRFTILGSRYSSDLARLLRTVCPGRAGGQNPLTSPGRVTGP